MNAIYTWRTIKILEKGSDMKLSELNYLLKREVEKLEIAKALGMDSESTEFKTLLHDAKNMGNKCQETKKERLKITKEEYIKYRQQCLPLRQIARIKKTSLANLQQWKKYHGITDKELVAKGILPKKCLYARMKKNETAQKR